MFSRSDMTGWGFKRIFKDAPTFVTAFFGLIAAVLTLIAALLPIIPANFWPSAGPVTATPPFSIIDNSPKELGKTSTAHVSTNIDSHDPQKMSENVNLIRVFLDSNEFLSLDSDRFSKYLKSATRDAWFVGTTFYIIADDFSDLIISKLRDGLDINFIILDPNSESLSRSARMLGYSNEEMSSYCRRGLKSLLKIRDEIIGTKYERNLSIWLTSEHITSRLYFFDPTLKTGFFYLVPQVNGMNSQRLPGLLFGNNGQKNIHLDYFEGAQRMKSSRELISIAEWVDKNGAAIAQKE